MRNSSIIDETDVFLWMSVSYQTSVRSARAAKSEDYAEMWQKQRVWFLTRLVETYKQRYETGTAPLEALVRAQLALLDARTEVAEEHDERVALLEEGAKSEARLLKAAESKCKASVCSARSLYLDAKIRIMRERGPKDHVAARIRAAAERNELRR